MPRAGSVVFTFAATPIFNHLDSKDATGLSRGLHVRCYLNRNHLDSKDATGLSRGLHVPCYLNRNHLDSKDATGLPRGFNVRCYLNRTIQILRFTFAATSIVNHQILRMPRACPVVFTFAATSAEPSGF